MVGLSLSVVLFLFLIVLPGNLAAVVAGRARRDFSDSVLLGGLFFCVTLTFLFLARFFWGSTVLDDSISFLLALNSSSGEVNAAPVLYLFALIYSLAAAGGLAELLFVTRWAFPQKTWLRFKKRALRGFFTRPRFNLSAGSLLTDIMIAYRVAGRKPFVKIYLKEGVVVQGECLKYTWEGAGAVLVRDADDVNKVSWVTLENALAVQFQNMYALQKCGDADVDFDNYVLLEMVSPGLYEDTVEALRRKKKEKF